MELENMECIRCEDTGYLVFEYEPDNTVTKRCPHCNPKDEELLEHNLQ